VKNGIVIYQGPSLLNGEPIIAILTGFLQPSANTKTGPMIQAWVLPQELPSAAIKNKRDHSVCGDCPLKGNICYVNPITLNNVYRAWQKNLYDENSEAIQKAIQHIKLHRLKVRITAYGEAPAAPYEIWEPFLVNYTGYTHQWNNPKTDPRWKGKLQASVHSLPEAEKAWQQGWSTFRITMPYEEATKEETLCTFVTQGIRCETCGLCKGKVNITDPIHGLAHKQNSFKKMRTNYKPAKKSDYIKRSTRFHHGTSADFFNQPHTPFWLTTSFEKAERFAINHEQGFEPRVLTYKLTHGRIFIYNSETALDYLLGEETVRSLETLPQSDRNVKIAELSVNLGYDGILFVDDLGNGNHSLVIFNSNVLESARPQKSKEVEQ
jgi:hypothetical protein